MALVSTKLTTSPVSIIAGTTTNKAITCAYLCNTTGSTVTISVYAVPNGATVGNCPIYNTLAIAAYDTAILDTEKIILGDGDAIYASASASNAIAMTISYVGI